MLRGESQQMRDIVVAINPELAVVVNRYIVLAQKEGETVENYKREIEHLKALVFKDEMTGVLNRRGFIRQFNTLFNEAVWSRKNSVKERKRDFEVNDFSVLFVDGDNFKKINDMYGHDSGDDVLKGLAKTLSNNLREIDSVGRFGGEEFVLALLGSTEENAYRKAEELGSKIKKDVKVPHDLEYEVSASIGVASTDNSDADVLDELIGYADQAMYEAKRRGKDRVVRWSEIKKPQ